MTRKHFKLIAGALKYSKPNKTAMPKGYKQRLQGWKNATLEISLCLRLTNNSYSQSTFLDACGYYEN